MPKGEHQRRECKEGVGRLLQEGVGGAAVVAAHDAGQRTNRGAQQDREEAHAEGDSRPEGDAAPDVAAEVVGAQPVVGARRVEDAFGVLRDWVVGREDGGEEGHRREQEHDGGTRRAKGVLTGQAQEAAHDAEGRRGRTVGQRGRRGHRRDATHSAPAG